MFLSLGNGLKSIPFWVRVCSLVHFLGVSLEMHTKGMYQLWYCIRQYWLWPKKWPLRDRLTLTWKNSKSLVRHQALGFSDYDDAGLWGLWKLRLWRCHKRSWLSLGMKLLSQGSCPMWISFPCKRADHEQLCQLLHRLLKGLQLWFSPTPSD